MKLLEKYHSSTDSQERAQLLEILQSMGIEPASPPPERLHKSFHRTWTEITEKKRQFYISAWAESDHDPVWSKATLLVSPGPLVGF